MNNIETLLCDYFRGTIGEAEGRSVDKWISESPENFAKAMEYARIQQACSLLGSDCTDIRAALDRVHCKAGRRRSRAILDAASRVAAALALPLLVTTLLLAGRAGDDAGPSQDVTLTTATGITASTTLPDGTEVWLNSNSTLSYPTRFARDRKVRLEGEGYFKVTKDDGRKFTVEAGGAEVEVLGTEFDVEAYEGAHMRTTLVTGSIVLHYLDSASVRKTVKVNPGEQYLYRQECGAISRSEVNVSAVGAWKDDRIVLSHTTLEDAFRMIGNRYNVDFLVRRPELLSERYTGVFSGQRLEVVLEHFSRITGMTFDLGLRSASATSRQTIVVD